MRHVLLLRALNVGGNNRLPMADLRALLERLGHTEVRTVLASGNATFDSPRTEGLAAEVETALAERGVPVRAVVLSQPVVRAMVDGLPEVVAATSYPLVGVLLGEPTGVPGEVAPDCWVMGEGCIYLGYANGAGRSRMTAAWLERALGTGVTSRTTATLLKLL